MRTDANVASGDSKLAALMQQGVTVAHIVQLLQTAFPIRWQQHLHNRLGATRPTDLTPAELAEFTDHVFWLVKQTGIKDPAAMLVFGRSSTLRRLQSNSDSGADRPTSRPNEMPSANRSHSDTNSSKTSTRRPRTGGPDNGHRKPLRRARE